MSDIINFKKSFIDGVNCDDDPRFVGENQSINMENLHCGVNSFSQNLQITNYPSTQLLNYYATYNSNSIGRVFDYARQRLISFNKDPYGDDNITAYDVFEQRTYTVLYSHQTVSGLNFSKSHRIARNARIEGNLLIWTDNNNEPQCVDVEAGIKLNHPSYYTYIEPYKVPIPYETLTLIKRPPIYPLIVIKSYDSGFVNNFTANNTYQACVRYQYKNYQYSALSPLSDLMPYNAPEEINNYLQIKLSFSEIIPDYVLQIDFIIRYGNEGKMFIVKSYNKNYYYDRVAIADHNNNSIQLGFAFYDNFSGIPLDAVTSATWFHNVALKAKTLESAKNRLFLANLLKGYNEVVVSSLKASLTNINTGAGGSYNGNWGYVTLHANILGGCQDSYMYPFVYIASGAPYKYYYFSSVRNSTIWNGGVGTVPSTININLAVFSGNNESDLINYLKYTQIPYIPPGGCSLSYPTWKVPYEISYSSLGAVTVYDYQPVSVNQFFKSGSSYEINILFKDRFSRPFGILKTGVVLNIPSRTYTQTNFTLAIQWTLSNGNAINEIPEDAYFYQIVLKRNQTTRFFQQIRTSGLQYVVKNQDGTYTYGNSFSTTNTYATAIDLTAFTSVGQGYTFNEGDLATIITSANVKYNLVVLGVDGNYVFVSPTDLGTGSSTVKLLTELYTPYKPQVQEPFFQVGDVYPIISPATPTRQYSTLTDVIEGDTYAIQRTDAASSQYIAEAMSPNDKFWQIWETDIGFPVIYTNIGQQQKQTSIDISNTYINGTQTNALNVFEALNSKDIGNDSGQIQKLQLANKPNDDTGNIMVVVAQDSILSAYLSEVQLYAAAQQGDVATTNEIIGTINSMKYTAGTLNPESIVEYNGLIWGVDVARGIVWQYDNNGVSPISVYGMARYFYNFSRRYIELGDTAIEELCGFSYIETCVDPSSMELLVTVPQTEANSLSSGIPVGFATALPSYTVVPDYASSIQNRFDIYDGQPKTLIYNFVKNKWYGAHQWLPDLMEYGLNQLYAFKNGYLYQFNVKSSSYNTVFGVQYPQRICFTVNLEPDIPKNIFDISIEGGQKIPNFTVCYTENPDVQITDLTSDDYTNLEGIVYAKFFRDRLSPNVSGSVIRKMYEGDILTSVTAFIMLEFQEYSAPLIINFCNIGFVFSEGHSQIIFKPKN